MKQLGRKRIISLLLMLVCVFAFSGCETDSTAAVAETGLPLEITQAEWVDAKEEIVLSTGITMKYVEMGQADGDVIIFLHGMTDNSRSWSLIAPYFTENYHVYLLDQRGHGDTDKPDLRMYPISLYASDLAAFMDEMEIETADIVGHSLGSMIAQTFAINYPEMVDCLVLESSTLVEPESLGTDLYDAAVSFGEGEPDDEFMAAWYYNPNPVDEEFLGYEMEESQNIPSYAWRAITKGCSFSDLTLFMSELTCPTLILWGSADGFFAEANQIALQDAIEGEEFIAYEGIGHNIQWEIPEQMAADVIAFLEQ